MWQVAQQYDGRSEDDALTPPRFLAQPGSGLAWQDGSNGVNSTPPAALLPSDCVLTNSRALRSIQSSVHSGFGGGGGGGAFACNIDQPQGMVCGGVGTSSASSERVGVSTAAHVGHEGGGSGGRNAGNGGGGGGGIPNCAIGDSALTPTESMDSSQHRMHHLLQSKQDSAQTSRSNSGAHWGPGPSIGIDDLRLVFGAPWASTCMSPTQHNSSVAGFTPVSTQLQALGSPPPFETFVPQTSWLPSSSTGSSAHLKCSPQIREHGMFAFEAGTNQQARGTGGRAAVPIPLGSADPISISSAAVTSMARHVSAECDSPPTTTNANFQNGLRMLVDAHAATTLASSAPPTSIVSGGGRTTSPRTLPAMGVAKHASGGRSSSQHAHMGAAADIAGGVPGAVIVQDASRSVTKVEFPFSSDDGHHHAVGTAADVDGSRSIYGDDEDTEHEIVPRGEGSGLDGSISDSTSSGVTQAPGSYLTERDSHLAACKKETITPEERLRKSRERNRDHSRRSRERKKAFVEGLKKQASELGAYRMLVEEANDLISAHTNDIHAIFTFASAGFDRMLGIDPKELVGKSIMDLVEPSDSQDILRGILAALRRGGIRQVQYRMTAPKGDCVALVESSFRVVSSRLVAITRVRIEGSSSMPAPLSQFVPLQSPPQAQQHSLAVSSHHHQHPKPELMTNQPPSERYHAPDYDHLPFGSINHAVKKLIHDVRVPPMYLMTQALPMHTGQSGTGMAGPSLSGQADFDTAAATVATCGW